MKKYTLQASIDALEKSKGGGGGGGSTSADNVTYDNQESGLTATDVQEALDELADRGADDVTYDNTESGLTADNVQAAIDEIAGAPDTIYPDDDNPVVVGKYGARDILRKKITKASLATGSNSLTVPEIDILIGVTGACVSNESTPRFIAVNSHISAADVWTASVLFSGGTSAALWVGSAFNGGSATIWIDYVAPIAANTNRRKK